MLEVDGGAWLVDGGSGTLQRCQRAGVDPRQLDGGLYSHHHPDHCGDLAPLLFAMRVGPPPRTRDYPIWAGAGFRRVLDGLQSSFGRWMTPGRGEVVLTELPLDTVSHVDFGAFELVTAPANHGAGALHLAFEVGGRRVVFSGDTGPSAALVSLAAGADLLVCECGGPIEGHLSPDQVAEVVAGARPQEVWLTHLYPGVDPAEAARTVSRAGSRVRLAADLDTFDLT